MEHSLKDYLIAKDRNTEELKFMKSYWQAIEESRESNYRKYRQGAAIVCLLGTSASP